MKLLHALPFAALSSAFVLPPEGIFANVLVEHHPNDGIERVSGDATANEHEVGRQYEKSTVTPGGAWEFSAKVKSALEDAFRQAKDTAQGTVDEAFSRTRINVHAPFGEQIDEAVGDVESWFEGHEQPLHHGRPPYHHAPNQTIYQLIASSKYTTKLAKLISEYDDLVDALNSTCANYTLFAPSDQAFAKIPDHAPKPSKEQLKAILSYHVVPDVYPASRVLQSYTAPTLLKGEHLSSEREPQRISFNLGLRGLTVNFFSRIFPINIFATNGVIHGLDSLLIPPPNAITIVDLFPTEFSTLELGLAKTGLLEKLNATDHSGGTLFAPSNFAFHRLGAKVNAFLFSPYGLKYLKALLEYHVVPGTTLYSDAIYQSTPSDVQVMKELPNKGHFHIDLPTLLPDRSLSVDVGRFGGFVDIRINGFASVAIHDGIAQDGVIQVVRNVLIPPKKIGGIEEHWDGGELNVEELMARLEPFLVYKEAL